MEDKVNEPVPKDGRGQVEGMLFFPSKSLFEP